MKDFIMKTLFDQLSDSDRNFASALIGCTDTASFRLTLREIEALEGDFVMGDVAIAWLEKRLSEIKRLREARLQEA